MTESEQTHVPQEASQEAQLSESQPAPESQETPVSLGEGGAENAPLSPPSSSDVSAQAEKVLTEKGDTLSDLDKQYLEGLKDLKGVHGVVTPNPDGTYSPVNMKVPETIPAESSTGPVTMKIGYRFKSDDIIVTLKADSLVLSNEVLTHKLAQRLMKEQPHDFRAYIKRGYYEANSNYFK